MLRIYNSIVLLHHNFLSNMKKYEVIIVGGSYAGLSAAMALGRSLRNVLVIDNMLPCNSQTPHSQNFLTQDGEEPAAISAKAKKQIEKYKTVEFYTGKVTEGEKTGNSFLIKTEDGLTFITKKLIFATGIKDLMPDIEGFAECWGISVIHCPYCHGYEFKSKKTAILANSERAFHLASLVNNLTDNLTLLTNGKPEFSEEQIQKLTKHNIQIIENKVTHINHIDGYMKSITFEDKTNIDFDAMYPAIPFVQHSDLPASLDCELTEMGHIKINTFQQTTVDGIFACGDNSNPMRSVAAAVAAGNVAGAMVNRELIEENF